MTAPSQSLRYGELRRRNCAVVTTWAIVMLLASSVPGEQSALALKLGDALPPLVGQTVDGKSLALPNAAAGVVAVVIFSFSRRGGRDAQHWVQHLSKDYPDLPIYSAIFLESVPRMFRSMAILGIRSGMPSAMLKRTLLLYQEEAFWKRRLHNTDENCACVVVLDQSGRIRWVSLGPFANPGYIRLRQAIRP